jgi:uncharacterized protein (TIGR03437 family)
MKGTLLAIAFGLVIGAGALCAQSTITSVSNESGESFLCPGGIAFVKGSGLGTSRSIVVTVGAKKAYVIQAADSSLQVELPVDAPQGATTITAGTSAAFNITLGQYCPGIPSNDVNSVPYVIALHDSSGKPVTAAFPAIPDELVDITVTGLGPTTPPYATGTAPPDANANTNAVPSVSIGGQDAKVLSSFLVSNHPGFYYVVARTPATITSGNQSVTVAIGGLTSNAAFLPLTTGGAVSSVTNAASYIDPSFPNGAIAQGAIAVATGKNLGPGSLQVDPQPFQNTTLGGTSVSISVGGTTVDALMYYTSFNQIAFLVPSNTPAGRGTITVTYAGQPGAQAPIAITPNNVGIFTVSSDGQGPGIVTYPDYSLVSSYKASNCGGPNTTCGAANPGDTLILWATGLGPVNGDDAAGAGLGVNMPNLPLTVWIGGVQAQVQYQGRSGCCVGEDQIEFTVPDGVPTGCAVPLAVQIGNFVSNTVAIPVATGSRSCIVDPAIAQIDPAQISGTVSLGVPELDHFINDSGTGFNDKVQNVFFKFTVPPSLQPFAGTYLANIPVGTCAAETILPNSHSGPPILTNLSVLDSGSSLTISGPNGSMTASVNPGDQATLSAAGSFLVPGDYTVTGSGGKDVGPFTATVTIPALPALTSPTGPTNLTVSRSKGLTVTWTPNNSPTHVEIEIASYIGNNLGARVTCTAPVGAGTFTIPSYVLLALPTGNGSNFSFQPGDGPSGAATKSMFSASGIVVGLMQAFVDGVGFGGFQITP